MRDEKNIDIDFSTFKDEIKYDRPKSSKKRFFQKRITLPIKPPGKKVVGAVIAAIIIVFLFVVFSGGDSESPDADLSGIQSSLEQLTAKVEDNNNLMLKKLVTLTDKVNQLQRRVDALGKRSGTAVTVSRQPVAQSSERYHTIRRGENLSVIAKKYGLTVTELCLLNDISPRKAIHPGQKLIVRK